MPPRNSSSIIMDSNPQSPISDAYRTLRTNVDFCMLNDSYKAITVTSSQQSEGKTTTVVNLAVAYAQSEKKVLLIDADLRKPSIHFKLSKSNRVGLSNVLAGQYPYQELIAETHVPNLDVLVAGPVPPNPSELLASHRWAQFMDEVKDAYDIVLVDTPPALTLPDALLASGPCSGVILVVDAGRVKREMVKKLISNMEHARAKVLGVVLNNINRKEAVAYAYK